MGGRGDRGRGGLRSGHPGNERGSSGLWPSSLPSYSFTAFFFFFVACYLSFWGCQKPLPRCTEGSRQGGGSQCPGDRLLLGIGGGGGGKECVKAIASVGQEVGTEGWWRRWRWAVSQGEDDKTCPRDLWCCASCLKGRGLCVKEHARAAVTAAATEGGTRTRSQEKVAPRCWLAWWQPGPCEDK